MSGLEAVLARHRWHTTIWADGLGGYGWRCSCGIVSTGSAAENPQRFTRHPDAGAARTAAVQHVAAAIREYLLSEGVVLAATRAILNNTIGDPGRGEPIVREPRDTADMIADARAALTAATEED